MDGDGLHGMVNAVTLQNNTGQIQPLDRGPKQSGAAALLHDLNQGENGVWLNYLKEVTSDLMLALFCWAQGMYKPAELELRCSIENYLKALIAITEEKIIEEKSVFRIFDKAKGDAHFQHTVTSKFLVSFENDYSTLCHTVHSDPKVISPVSALGAIAGYIPSNPDEFQTLIIRMAEGYMGCLYFNYPAIIDKMHPENKKDFLDCLQKSTKQKIIKALFED